MTSVQRPERDDYVICEIQEDGWSGSGPCLRAGCVRILFNNGALVELISGAYACVEYEHMRVAGEGEIDRIEHDYRNVMEGLNVDQNALDALRSML